MRPTRPIGALLGLLAIGGVAAGCGTATKHPTASAPPTAPIAAHPDPVHIRFLKPAQGASLGSTVTARVTVSGRGRVRFVLDRGRPRTANGLSVVYRHLAAGRHRVLARIVPAAGRSAEAAVTFEVRHASASPPAPVPTASTTTTPAPSTSSPTTAPAAPPAPPRSAPAPPPPKSTPSPPSGGGIPQGGGGDGDGDNSGGPSDGDGNV